MFKKNDLIALVACSNAINEKNNINLLEEKLNSIGLSVLKSKYLTTNNSKKNLAEDKARELENFYNNKSVKAIFDISGGDYANSILSYLNFEILKENYKPFFGYSDLTTIINSIYAKNKQISYLYQVTNILHSKEQLENFEQSFFYNKNNIFEVSYIGKKENISGEVIGGNIRCFLKLAGTPYFPNTENKILFLESLSGNKARIETYLEQLRQIGCFNKVKAVLLGTFTELQNNYSNEEVIDIVKNYVKSEIPILKTEQIGHNKNSKCLKIGDIFNI